MTDQPTQADVLVTDEDVEAAAEAMWAATWDTQGWGHASASTKAKYHKIARAALTAYTGRLTEERDALKSAILDIDAHSTALGEDSEGFVQDGYVVSVGAMHRALGLVGHTAKKRDHAMSIELEHGPKCAGCLAVRDTVLTAIRDAPKRPFEGNPFDELGPL